MKKVSEITLAILKPHICKDPYSKNQIIAMISNDGFKTVRSNETLMTRNDAEQFYAEHKDKFFYDRLVTFMSSGPVSLHILARENAIARWRELMGPTKVFRTKLDKPYTIRGLFGLSDTRNATHGSDSDQSAREEIAFFFPDFDYSAELKRHNS